MARDHFPTNELVAVALLKQIPGLPADKISTTLPADKNAWKDTGFVQVSGIGGSPDIDLPQANPVVTIDFYWNGGDTAKPQWGKAANLAEIVRHYISDNNFSGQQVDPGANFKMARVLNGWFVTEPRRIEGNENSYARVSVDVELKWAVVG